MFVKASQGGRRFGSNVPAIGHAWHLLLFRDAPDTLENRSKASTAAATDLSSLRNRLVSSAYRLILNSRGGEAGSRMPTVAGLFRMMLARFSIHRAYRKGDRLHPCLTLRPTANNFERPSLTLIQLKILVYSRLTHAMSDGPNPNLLRVSMRNR